MDEVKPLGAGFSFDASLPLNITDLSALLAFKASLTSHDKLLDGWTNATHPW